VRAEALKIMKDEAKKEIRSKGFGSKFQQQNIFVWSQRQLWRTIKLLVRTPYIPYDRLIFTVFDGNEAALKALAQANILSFVTINHQKMVRIMCTSSRSDTFCTLIHSFFSFFSMNILTYCDQ
jgi:hypothetical protein